MSHQQNTVFIAYCRDVSLFMAVALYHGLAGKGYDVFMDIRRPKPASESVIHNQIKARSHFLLLFAPTSTGIFYRSENWLQNLAEYAYYTGRNIVPVYAYSSHQKIPCWYQYGTLRHLGSNKVIKVSYGSVQKAISKLHERFSQFNQVVTLVPTPSLEVATTQNMVSELRHQPIPKKRQLEAEYYLNHGDSLQGKAMRDNIDLSLEYIAAYTKAIQLNPGYATPYYRLSVLKKWKRDYVGQLTDLDRAIRFDPHNVRYYVSRGYTHANKLHDLEGSLADYAEAIRLRPDCVPAYTNRAALHRNQNDFDAALADIEMAIQLEPSVSKHYVQQGIIYEIQGHNESALAKFAEAIRVNPEEVSTFMERARFYEKQGNYKAATNDHSEAIQLTHGLEFRYIDRGQLYERMGELDKALADYTQAIARNHYPYSRAYVYRASIKYKQGNIEKALIDLADAIHLTPNDSYAYDVRGCIRFEIKDYEGAIADFTEAIRCHPTAHLYYNRAATYVAKGEAEKAIADYLKILEFDEGKTYKHAEIEK